MKFKTVRLKYWILSSLWLLSVYSACAQTQSERFFYIQFESDGDTLSGEDSLQLGDFIYQIPATPYRVFVIGHTDADGSNAYNFGLSERRAQAVLNYIHTIQPQWKSLTRLSFEGEESPIASNASDYGKSLNRRVAVRVFYPDSRKRTQSDLNAQNTRIPAEKPRNAPKKTASSTQTQKTAAGVPIHRIEVLDAESQDSLQAEYSIFSLDGNSIQAQETVQFSTQLNVPTQVEECRICVQKAGYIYACQKFVQTQKISKTYTFELQKLQKGAEFTLKDLVFFTDSDIPRPESFPELNALVRTLQANPSLKILIKGHANWPPSYGPAPAYIFNLSKSRARAVIAFLLNYDIELSRLEFKGIGNLEPIYTEPETWEEVDANKRVNFTILEF